MKPIIPFEPILGTDGIPSGEEWIAQIKWDGVRMLSYYDGQDVQLVNRRLNNRSLQYPEFLSPEEYCKADSFILDGEFIAFDETKPSFYEIMKRDSQRLQQNIEWAASRTPVTYMIFDVLYVNGEWIVDQPLRRRQQILADIVRPSAKAQVVESFADADGLLQTMKTHRMEGIVLKNLNSTYLINGKDGRWVKRKLYNDLCAVVGGFTMRAGIANSLLLGVYSKESFLYIGHAGAGKLSNADWLNLTRQLEPLQTSISPFSNQAARSTDAIWVHPRIVVKVTFAQWTASHTMRQPSIQSINVDLAARDCYIP